jgi:hypothetical protein
MSPQVVYIVNRLHWEYNDAWYDVQGDSPVRAFRSRRDAEAECKRLETEMQRKIREALSDHEFRNPHLPGMVCEPFYEVVKVEWESHRLWNRLATRKQGG